MKAGSCESASCESAEVEVGSPHGSAITELVEVKVARDLTQVNVSPAFLRTPSDKREDLSCIFGGFRHPVVFQRCTIEQ